MNDDAPEPGATVVLAGGMYAVLLAGGLGWLWLRERLDQLPAAALGEFGLLGASAAGLLAGLAGSQALAQASRWVAPVRRVEARMAALLGPLGEGQVRFLALASAVAEELFFRLAAQDALGLPLAVAFYALLNTGPGFLAWLPVATGFGLVFGLLVASGCGLLSATVAHALVNYLSLRRILPP